MLNLRKIASKILEKGLTNLELGWTIEAVNERPDRMTVEELEALYFRDVPPAARTIVMRLKMLVAGAYLGFLSEKTLDEAIRKLGEEMASRAIFLQAVFKKGEAMNEEATQEWHRACKHSLFKACITVGPDGQKAVVTELLALRATVTPVAEWCHFLGRYMMPAICIDGEGAIIDSEC